MPKSMVWILFNSKHKGQRKRNRKEGEGEEQEREIRQKTVRPCEASNILLVLHPGLLNGGWGLWVILPAVPSLYNPSSGRSGVPLLQLEVICIWAVASFFTVCHSANFFLGTLNRICWSNYTSITPGISITFSQISPSLEANSYCGLDCIWDRQLLFKS